MAIQAVNRQVRRRCWTLCVVYAALSLALGACAGICPDRAGRHLRDADQLAGRAAILGSGPATRDVFHRPFSNATVLLLDRHAPSAQWTGPLTMAAAIRTGLSHSATLAACFADLGVTPEQLRQLSLPQGRGEAVEAFFETPQGYSQLTPGWPRVLAEEHVRSVLRALGRQGGDDPRLSRLELTAVAAALDVILDVRERWYLLVAASQAHVATMDELLAAEATWQMAQAAPSSQAGGQGTANQGISSRAEAQTRFEAAQRETVNTELALRDARQRMQRSMGLGEEDAGWNVPPLLPGRPVQEFVVDERSLDEAQWRSVNASIDLALARLETPMQSLAADIASRTAAGYSTTNPATSSGHAVTRHHSASGGELRQSRLEPGSSWANWAFPAPFFSPSFTLRPATQPAQERDWRRYQAMAAVIRGATRTAGQEFAASRQALERLEQKQSAGRVPQNAGQDAGQPTGLAKGPNGGRNQEFRDTRALFLGDTGLDALSRRRGLIAAQLDYWIARSRLEHLLAGRLAVGHSPLAFRQVSIMQPPAE